MCCRATHVVTESFDKKSMNIYHFYFIRDTVVNLLAQGEIVIFKMKTTC